MKVHLSDAIGDYKNHRTSKGRAKNTLNNDRQTLTAFLTSVGNIYVENVTDRHVDEFMSKRSLHRAPGSLNNDQTVLRQFFKWCRLTKRMHRQSDPMADREAIPDPDKERARVHVSKFPALLDAAGQRAPRDRAFVALGLYTLSRAEEIAATRLMDLDLDSGYLRVKVTKSYKEDRVPIPLELDQEMRQWLTYYAENCGTLDPTWYLVPARRLLTSPGVSGRDALTVLQPTRKLTHIAGLVVKPALEAIGFTVDGQEALKGEGAHTLRRSAARAKFDSLIEDGYDYALRVVQAMLHHKNLSQTEHYIGITADRRTRDDIIRGKSMFGLPEVRRLEAIKSHA